MEGPSKRNPAELCGRASNNKMCVFPQRTPVRGGAPSGKQEKYALPGGMLPGGSPAMDPPPLKPGDYVDVVVTGCTSATLLARLA